MDGKFVDELDGTAHPTAMDPYLVEWKRPETLLADTLQVPVVVLREKEEPEEGEGEAKEAAALEQLTLEPYERDHAVVIGTYRAAKKKKD